MKEFLNIRFDAAQCGKEIVRLKALLDSKRDLSERDDLQPLLKDCQQLAAFIGASVPNLGLVDRLAYEFPIFGDFCADIVVGNYEEKKFCAIEMEDARPNSILNKLENRSTSEWGRRFEHGFSQLVDWFFTLDDHKNTAGFTKHFGHGHIEFIGLLLIGRSGDLTEHDRTRLLWRPDKVSVNTHKIYCRTYDELYRDLSRDWRLIAETRARNDRVKAVKLADADECSAYKCAPTEFHVEALEKTMKHDFKRLTDFLVDLGIEKVGHTGKTYLAHLIAVYLFVKDRGGSEELCRAGMFHSIYGTEMFQGFKLSLESRAQVRELIGERAERLAYLNCAMNRASFDGTLERDTEPYRFTDRISGEEVALSRQDFDDLCRIHLYDWLEQAPRSRFGWDYRHEAYRRMMERSGDVAREAYDRVFAEVTKAKLPV